MKDPSARWGRKHPTEFAEMREERTPAGPASQLRPNGRGDAILGDSRWRENGLDDLNIFGIHAEPRPLVREDGVGVNLDVYVIRLAFKTDAKKAWDVHVVHPDRHRPLLLSLTPGRAAVGGIGPGVAAREYAKPEC